MILDIPNKNTGDMMTVMLKMSDDGGFWSVSNAAIVRMKYLEKFEKLSVVSGDGSRNASGKRQGLSQSSEHQTTIGADNALPTGNSDITTPKSEVNTLKQELAKSRDAQRLMNSGKVEVVQSESDLPANIQGAIISSNSSGSQGLFIPTSNKTYLIDDNLSTADAMGVLTHEVGVHAWFNTANSEKKAALEKRAVGLLKTRKLAGGELRTFLDSVNERLIDAGHVDNKGNVTDNEEAVSYIVEQAINQFGDSRYLLNDNKLLDTIGKASKSLANFIADVITYLKSSMHKLGWMDTQKLTAGDLVAIAKGNMREVAQNDVGVNDGIVAGDMARTLASFASDKPIAQEIADAQRELDKQLAIADKLEAEYGYLPAPNGEKSNLNRNQWAQVRTPQFKEFYGDWKNESGRIYREMDGDTGSALNTRTEGASSAGRYRGRSGNESVLSGVREGKQLNIEQVCLDDNGEPRIYPYTYNHNLQFKQHLTRHARVTFQMRPINTRNHGY